MSINIVTKLLVDAGRVCSEYQDKTHRGMKSKRIQWDEIWSLVGCKKKNVTAEKKRNGQGDVWTWTAPDPEPSSFRAGTSALVMPVARIVMERFMTATETESIQQTERITSGAELRRLIRTLERESGLRLLREHWSLLLPKDPGIALESVYNRLLPHH